MECEMSLNINNLKQNKNEILKAEIVSLFSLLEKTFTEWWKGKGFFKTFTNQHNVTQEIDNLLSSLQNISIKLHPKINNNVYGNSLISFNAVILYE